jgi:hypothetical protein
MFAKKTPMTSRNKPYSEQLETLYARRSTLDTLIATLEQYDRYQAQSEQGSRRKSA